MKYYTLSELAKLCNTTERQLSKDFPDTAVRQLRKGKLIGRIKNGKEWKYTFEIVEPREGSKDEFKIINVNRGVKDETNLLGEIWIDTYFSNNYEVSNFGRVRNKTTKIIHNGTTTPSGYQIISILG